MKIKTKFVVVVFIMGIVSTFYATYSFFADGYTMTEEEYAREAMAIVHDSNQSSQPLVCGKVALQSEDTSGCN